MKNNELLKIRIRLIGIVHNIRRFMFPDRFYTTEFIDQKYHKSIGKYTYGYPIIIDWNDGGRLTIGKFCSIAGGTRILLGGNHRSEWVTTYPFPSRKDLWPEASAISGQSWSKGDVVIGNDVLLGQDCLILSGTKIGDGAIIGAGAVVTKEVPPYTIVAGNPAKQVRTRFPQKIIAELLSIKWWDWEESKIRKFIPLLCDENITQFISQVKRKK